MKMRNEKNQQTGYGCMGTEAWMLRKLIPSVLLLLSVTFGASADRIEWTGIAGDGKWETKENWSGDKVPDDTDDVIIPKNSGDITTNGIEKELGSLDIKESDNGIGTTIEPEGPGKDMDITASGDITIGKGNTVRGSDGDGGLFSGNGGDLDIESKDGDVTNNGTLEGGDGVTARTRRKAVMWTLRGRT